MIGAIYDFGKYNHDLGDCIVYLLGEFSACTVFEPAAK